MHLQKHVTMPGFLTESLLLFIFFVFSGCSFNFHDDVYTLVSAKIRMITSVAISPGDGTEYAFTIDTQPAIEISCPVSGAITYYSIDGSADKQYAGAFNLPVNDPKIDHTFTVTAYCTHPGYQDSAPVSQTYRFVATVIPMPTIQATASSPAIETALTGAWRFDHPPVITLTCPLASATIWYSLDNGLTYSPYSAPFSLSVPADWNSSGTVSVLAYATYDSYADSAILSKNFNYYGNGTIITIAGKGGSSGFSDGDGIATNAVMNKPQGLYVDAAGSVYVADSANHCVRKITIDGHISTFAGIPTVGGYDYTNCPATSAKLYEPRGLTADAVNGFLYIADSRNFCVRKVSLAGGTISDVAGTPGVAGTSSDGTLCSLALFGYVYGIFFDSVLNKLFIADNGAFAIWRVDNDGVNDLIFRYAGLGAGYSYDGGDGGDALGTGLVEPVGFTRLGTAFLVSDHNAKKIRSINTGTMIVTTAITATGKPYGLFSDGTTLYYADDDANQVKKAGGVGAGTVIAGTGSSGFSGDGGLATAAQLNSPSCVFVVSGDGVYITDTDNHCIRKIILY